MSVSPEFRNIVDNGSITAVRSYLANYLIGEDDFQLFDDALAYAKGKLEILQEHDGQEFTSDVKCWTNEYLSELLVSVVTNFSQPRIDHIKAVVAETIIKPKTTVNTASVVNKPQSSGHRTGRTVVSETIVYPPRSNTNQSKPQATARPVTQTTRPVNKTNTTTGSNSKTGRCVISETEKRDGNASDSKSHGAEYGTALMVGGAAVTAIGVATVKPVVIGAGVAMVGTGAAIRANSKRK